MAVTVDLGRCFRQVEVMASVGFPAQTAVPARPGERVLDLGCGHGELLERIQRHLGAEVLGLDLRLPVESLPGIPTLMLDVVRDALQPADVAVSVCIAHHRSDDQLACMIRNLGQSCRRLLRRPQLLLLLQILLEFHR